MRYSATINKVRYFLNDIDEVFIAHREAFAPSDEIALQWVITRAEARGFSVMDHAKLNHSTNGPMNTMVGYDETEGRFYLEWYTVPSNAQSSAFWAQKKALRDKKSGREGKTREDRVLALAKEAEELGFHISEKVPA